MKGIKKRCMAFAVSMSVLCSVPFNTQVFAAPSDISGHWAENIINDWTSQGYISGYPDGTFKPDNSISRTEFVTLVNKAFNYSNQANISFSDVNIGYWGYNEIQKGVAGGYISGNSDGTFNPDGQVTRQEAAVMLSRVKGLTENENAANSYVDSQNVASWAKSYVGGVSNAEIMQGFPDGSFRPTNSMTRAEAVTSIDKAFSSVLGNQPNSLPNVGVTRTTTAATNTSSSSNNRTLSTNITNRTTSKDDVILEQTTLSDRTIKGDLIIPSSMSSRNITLKNLNINGRLIVEGGDTITLQNCNVNEAVLDKKDVTLKSDSKSTIGKLSFERNGKITGNGYEDVYIDDDNVTSVTIDAEVDKVLLDTDARVYLQSNADIDEFEATSDAGTTTVSISRGATVDTMDVYSRLKITGSGKIGTMNVYKSGVRSSIEPRTVRTKNGASKPTYSDYDDDDDDDNDYDDLTIDEDNDDFDGDGDRYDDVRIEVKGANVKDFIVYGDLTIDKAVGTGTVKLTDVEVRGNVYVYGGGDNSVIFRNCKIKGSIISDADNRKGGDSDEAVALKFNGSTTVGGKIRVRGNTIIDSDNTNNYTIDNVQIERTTSNPIEISTKINTVDVLVKSKINITDGGSIETLNLLSGSEGTTVNFGTNNNGVGTINSNVNSELTGTGKVDKLVTNNETTIGPNVTIGAIQKPSDTTTTVNVTGVTITPNPITVGIGAGKTVQLTANVQPSNATNKNVTWTIDNSNIATVSSSGLVTGVADGTATVTVTTADGQKTATCVVTVSKDANPTTPTDPTNPSNPATPSDGKELEEAIERAEKAKEGVVVDVGASSVPIGTKWVMQRDLDTFDRAINKAKNTKDTATLADTLKAAALELNNATDTFLSKLRDGAKTDKDPIDRTKLKAAIDLAKDNLENTPVSEDGVKVSDTKKWVTEETKTYYQSAIDRANTVYLNKDASQEEIDEAVGVLKATTDTFNGDKKQGLCTQARQSLLLAIMNAEKYEKDGANDEQWEKFQAAIENAEKVANNPESNETSLKSEQEALAAAVKEFEEVNERFIPVTALIGIPDMVNAGEKIDLRDVTLDPYTTVNSAIEWELEDKDFATEKGVVLENREITTTTTTESFEFVLCAKVPKGGENKQDFSEKYTIKVIGKDFIPATGLLNYDPKLNGEMIAGEIIALNTATIAPTNATANKIEWSLSDVEDATKHFVTLESNSIIKTTAASAGYRFSVIAVIKNGEAVGRDKTVTFSVFVKEDPNSGFEPVTDINANSDILNALENGIRAGTSIALGGTVDPINATYKTIKWSLANEKEAKENNITLKDSLLTISSKTPDKYGFTIIATVDNAAADGKNFTKSFNMVVDNPNLSSSNDQKEDGTTTQSTSQTETKSRAASQPATTSETSKNESASQPTAASETSKSESASQPATASETTSQSATATQTTASKKAASKTTTKSGTSTAKPEIKNQIILSEQVGKITEKPGKSEGTATFTIQTDKDFKNMTVELIDAPPVGSTFVTSKVQNGKATIKFSATGELKKGTYKFKVKIGNVEQEGVLTVD